MHWREYLPAQTYVLKELERGDLAVAFEKKVHFICKASSPRFGGRQREVQPYGIISLVIAKSFAAAVV